MTPAEEEKIMMTNNIKRYTVCNDIAYPIHEDPEGDYVLYEDHVAAIESDRQRIAELESQLEAIGAGGVSSQRITSQRRGEPYNPRKPTEEEWRRLTENGRRAWGNHPAVPEKEPPCET